MLIDRLRLAGSAIARLRRNVGHWPTPVALLLGVGWLTLCLIPSGQARAEAQAEQVTKTANFNGASASRDTRTVADWVVAHADNRGLPFIIVDKVAAKVFAFDASGVLRGSAPVLLGLTRGDDSPVGIGSRKLASMSSQERITPAGRFVSAPGHNLANKEILWIDYESALSLHPVITTNPSERRLARMETLTISDNRISYGCINVPAEFYQDVIRRMFTTTSSITYVLPEVKSIYQVFAINSRGGDHSAAP